MLIPDDFLPDGAGNIGLRNDAAVIPGIALPVFSGVRHRQRLTLERGKSAAAFTGTAA